jgi:hypothetical protein
MGVERDTRVDPILTRSGDRTWVVVEPSAYLEGDDSHENLRIQAGYERWIPLGSAGHVVSLHATAGVIFAQLLPYFDHFYVGDWNPLLPPRALDLVVSTRPSPGLLGASIEDVRWGDWAAAARLEYAYRLFRRTRRVYGGDLYVGAGVFGLGSREAFDREVPIDLMFDAGLRLDTEIGIFELGLANGLGRIPL